MMASITHLNIFNSRKGLPVSKTVDILDIFTQSARKMAEKIVQQDQKEFLTKITASTAIPHLTLFSNGNTPRGQMGQTNPIPVLKVV